MWAESNSVLSSTSYVHGTTVARRGRGNSGTRGNSRWQIGDITIYSNNKTKNLRTVK
uniref:Uncharacterized protein n=1 Tax=Arundo donax TaxID=35708 RepID=A0A0A9AD97_ARUDO